MTGQDAVNVAESFAERVDFDGVLLTKLDGDARGGAALSVRAVTGKPIMYVSTGERVEQLERFHPERMASRILGMGDVLSLIEKAEEVSDADQAAELERKIRKQQFTLEDFLTQMRQVRKMGPLQNVLGMMPGMGGKAMKQLRQVDMDDRELDRLEAIILSMTPGRAGQPDDDRRLPPQADRAGLGDDDPGGEPARQAVRPDAEDDGPARSRQDARPGATHEGHALSGRSPANLLRRNGPYSSQKGGFAKEPDLARGRRRPPLAARWAHDRDDRPLQPPDRPLGDRDRRRARAPLARPRSAAHPHGGDAPAHQGDPGLGRPSARMRDLVEFCVRALVSDPDAVRVEELDTDDGTVLEVHVADDDLGRVIGREGRVANAIRTLAKAAATADDAGRVMVEIVED